VRDYVALDRYAHDRMAAWTEELRAFCAIPSEETQTAALLDAAEWTRARLARLGAAVGTVALDGVAPLIVGTIGTGPTLVAVQHYDVQPAVPLELWTTPPYDPQIRDGRLYARGAVDNKGEFLSRVWGVEAYLETFGELPCRIRFVVEGEEEHGSPNLDRLLDLDPDLRVADGALEEGGGVDIEGRPEIVGGGRGMLVVELIAKTIAYDAHSSAAMLLPNAAIRLVQALSTLWRTDGLPAIDVAAGAIPPSAAQLAVLAAVPVESIESLRDEFEIPEFLARRSGAEVVHASTFEPTFNLQAMWSGYTGPGSKTIVPAEAHARIDIRLVPDQDPDEIFRTVRDHLDKAGFPDVEVRRDAWATRAYWTPPDHPILAAAGRAASAVFEAPAQQYVAMAGTIPMFQVCARNRIPLASLGGGHEDCRAHAPDENYRLDFAEKAALVMTRFIDEFAALDRA
jgi:acetylornithine deacetylase/succinyl-diaminopimelate desuccinylase-like protein